MSNRGASASSTIRPLGEEHLRMFRRTVGSEPQTTPKISAPEEAKIHGPSVFLSKETISFNLREARNFAASQGGRLATTSEVVFDERFVKSLRGQKLHYLAGIFIDWREMPEIGFYWIDRKNHTLIRISKEEAKNLEWHEKLSVPMNAYGAPTYGRPLSLNIETTQDDSKSEPDMLILQDMAEEDNRAPVAIARQSGQGGKS